MRVARRYAARYFSRMRAFAAGREPYADSVEELTPVRRDWISAVPLVTTAIALLAAPKAGGHAGEKGLGRASARPGSIRLIESEHFR